MKKGVLILVIVGLLSLLLPFHAFAETTPVNIVINGEKFVSPKGEPAPYANKDQRTLIPIRFFAEKLGVPNDDEHIQWDQETQTATITDGVNTVQIPLGSKEIKVNGETVIMDTVAEEKNGRIFIPARFLAEGLGAQVLWDQQNMTAVFLTQSYLDNHIAMKTADVSDIDDIYILDAFYRKFEHTRNMQKYKTVDELRETILDLEKVTSKIKVERKGDMVHVTLPDYDKKKYRMRIDTRQGQYFDPGTYTIDLNEPKPDGKPMIFAISVSDHQRGSVTLFIGSAYLDENGEVSYGVGNIHFDKGFGGGHLENVIRY